MKVAVLAVDIQKQHVTVSIDGSIAIKAFPEARSNHLIRSALSATNIQAIDAALARQTSKNPPLSGTE